MKCNNKECVEFNEGSYNYCKSHFPSACPNYVPHPDTYCNNNECKLYKNLKKGIDGGVVWYTGYCTGDWNASVGGSPYVSNPCGFIPKDFIEPETIKPITTHNLQWIEVE